MEPIWFWLVAIMIVAYVVLDGFDLGAGVVHLLLARTDAERRLVIRTIGPVWDGNEVWLLAGGGTLYFAFPLVYASSFSGFYLPLNIVLWLLILRGIGVEFRMHLEGTVWTGLFDGFFALSSTLLAVFFGAALGNVIRGVPLDQDHFFFEPLWTSFLPHGETGILDWYTTLTGVFALAALTMHGALYVSMKTLGDVHERAARLARRLLPAVVLLTVVGVPVTALVRPATLGNYRGHPALFMFPLAVAISLAGVWRYSSKHAEVAAFLSSCAYIVFMLCGAAVALYPALLPSSADSGRDITIYNAASGHYALSVGLIWWGLGMALAIGYFVFVYRMFRGKVTAELGAGH
ncbi:MAG: cytochrome d ubiquinol oxidase subunit II [Steroidobacteraceae bacterium]